MIPFFRKIAWGVLPVLAVFTTQWAFSQDDFGLGATQAPLEPQVQAAGEFCCDQVSCCDPHCFWTSPTLTGDWCGIRSCLQESGVTFSGQSTHFAYGINGGINRLPPVPLPLGLGNTFKYTGRGEYDFTFDLEKFGGMPKGTVLLRMEHWYGEYGNISTRTGAFVPAIFPAALPPAPDNPGDLFMTDLILTQPLSPELTVFVGKKDVLGSYDQDIFAGGDGTSQFDNQALIANPAFLLGLPYSGFTVGAVMPREWGKMILSVYDPKDRTQDFFNLGDLFANGVIVSGQVTLNTKLLGLPGEHHVGAMWKHVDLTDLRFQEPPPGVYPEPVVPGFPTLPDSYTVYYGFDQYLVLYSDQPEKGWGLFGRASISDGNPTPVRYFLSTGVGGHSILRGDRGDNWGIGWYYIGASNEFGPLPRALFNPQDGTGVEMFYNFQVTPWLNVSPAVQFLRPGARAIAEDAFIYGLRVNVTL